MRNTILIIIFGIISISSFGQLNEFLIGYYSYDYDNKTYIPTGTDKSIGNDLAFLQLVSDLGVNYVHVAYQLYKPNIQKASSTPSKTFLDRASSLGLNVILGCPDIGVDRNNPIYNSTESNQGLSYYGNHPSIIGFDIHDEPRSTAFAIIDDYSDDIKDFNPNLLSLSNLFPNIASNSQLFGTDGWPSYDDYTRYVQEYIDATNPNILSFDHYPIWYKTNCFFTNLDIFAKKSASYNIPFIYVLTNLKTTPSPFYCNLTPIVKNKAEFNYVIFASLVYGAKGISYWHATCANDFFGVISPDVNLYLKNLHSKLKSSSKTLLKLHFRSVYHYSSNSTILSGKTELLHSSSIWSQFSSDQYAKEIFDINNPIIAQTGSKIDNVVISFLTDDVNNKYFWIFNKSIIDDEYIQINFKENTALIDILDNKIYEETQSRVVYLESGEAKLFKINKNFQSNTSTCNVTYASGIYPDVWAENTTIGGTSCSVRYLNGANMNYYAKKISLKKGVNINQGSKISFNGATMSYGTLKNASIEEETSSQISDINESATGLTIYPNPNSGHFSVYMVNENSRILSLAIYNIAGMKVAEKYGLDANNVDFTYKLTPGTYFIKINSTEGYKNEKLLIK